MADANQESLQPPKLPGIIDVYKQLRRDLFGKDVENAATYTYEWIADQLGHFALGFTGVFLLLWFNRGVFRILESDSGWIWALAIILIFVLVETNDFISQWKAYQKSARVFKFNALEILWNMFTAIYYIAIGAIVAAFGIDGPSQGFWSAFIGFILFNALAIWWLERKICFQQAGLPTYFRLPFFQNQLTIEQAQFIADLATPSLPNAEKQTNRHLILAGPLSSGKSTLACAIGTEFAVRSRMGIGRYTTFSKLIETVMELALGDDHVASDGRILWPWQTSELLLVDDVDVIVENLPGAPQVPHLGLEIAKKRAEWINSQVSPEIHANLKFRRTVWVIGDVTDGELNAWREVLAATIEVSVDHMTVIRFENNIRDLDPKRECPVASRRIRL